MRNANLTKVQQVRLDQLQQYGTLYIGHNCPNLLAIFDKLVEKGLATVDRNTHLGKTYRIGTDQ